MHNAGWKFRQFRERLNLTFRDIEEATRHVANAKLNPEYLVTISRLSEIENNNVVPSIYRLYSLCVVYQVSFAEALRWYGVNLQSFLNDASLFSCDKTQLVPESADDGEDVKLPIRLDPGFSPQKTSYLSRMIQAWGTTPLVMLRQLDAHAYRYGYVGMDDWMMYPLIMPGSLVQIDPERRKVESQVWKNDFERPIYFLETRSSYYCTWLTPMGRGELLIQPYSLSPCKAIVVATPAEATVVGQVIGAAMHLASAQAGKARATTDPRSG
jgi:transcriptional regulator with XRE-family HTH domain